MLDWSQCTAVERTAGKVSGARIEEFLEWFPGVTQEQVLAVLRHTEETLAESAA